MESEANILVVLPLEEYQREILEAAAPKASFSYRTSQTVTPEDLSKATILIGWAPAELCRHATKLEWYQSHTSGPDAYLKEGVIRPEAIITSATGAYGLAVPEHMLAMTLMIIKRLHTYRDAQRSHLWKSQGAITSIWNSNVLVIGLGDLGIGYAKLCSSLGAHVVGVRRTIAPKPFCVEEVYTGEELDNLLPKADIVALCLPDNQGTRHMMDERRLSLMKPGSVLINGGRGASVDTDALLRALRSGHIFGAGLDVTDPEPLPPDHPLWDEPSAVITPHVAGGFYLPENLDRIVRISAENLRRYFAGEQLMNVMDRATGNRHPLTLSWH